jgi:hypothetical protein
MVLSIIFLEDKHKILLHLSIFYEYQQFFQHRVKTPTGNFSDVFFILDKINERPDWMTDLRHTDNAW